MMRHIIILSIGISLFFSCTNSEKSALEETRVNKSEDILDEHENVEPTKVLSFEITGMSCEMGCGSAIRKELYKTNAVNQVSFDFKMGRDNNTVYIYYDDTKTSVDKISKILNTMNDKQFEVKMLDNIDYISENSDDEKLTSYNGGGSSLGVVLPNFFDLILQSLYR